jgi:hypothetical protein
MSMNRRAALSLAGLAALRSVTKGSAQPATPSASPIASPAATPKPEKGITLHGLQSWVARYFDSSQGKINYGPGGFEFMVMRFDTEDNASKALSKYAPAVIERAFDGYDASDVRPTSVRKIGDQAEAYSGEVRKLGSNDTLDNFEVAYVSARVGAIVFYAYGWAWLFSPLEATADILQKMATRSPSPQPVVTDQLGMKSGGDWSLLPTLADVPEGMRFSEDRSGS